jgi:hypothetical protein
MCLKRIVVLFLLISPSPALADPIFIFDGAIHDVDSPTNRTYSVSSGTLNILPGATALAVSADGPDVSITMSGGQVAAGIEVDRGKLEISGGESRGFDNPVSGGDAVELLRSTASISGGTFTGGNSPGQPGNAVTASATTMNGVTVASTLTISGGTFVGGMSSDGSTRGNSLATLGNMTVSGGLFLSPISIHTLSSGSETDFLGTNLTFQDHILSGLLQNGDPIHVQVFGVDGVVNDTGTEVRFGHSSANPSLPEIPEPSTAWVFTALAALGLAYRR